MSAAEEAEDVRVDGARVNGGTASVAVVDAIDMVSSSEMTDTVESDRTLVLVLPRPIEVRCDPGCFHDFDSPCRSGKIANARGPKFRISWKVSVTGRTSGGHTADSTQRQPAFCVQHRMFLKSMQPSITYQTHHFVLIYRIRSSGVTLSIRIDPTKNAGVDPRQTEFL